MDLVPTERRLAAILAADVVGYSRLMGADEMGTLRALKAMRGDVLDPTIAAHRGRIVKTTGDGMLVEFASVVDAVSCAVAIQRGLRRAGAQAAPGGSLTLRIGVNIGDIIIDGEDIFGDGVNLASRLESICQPGGITISRAVHEQVRDKLDFPFADLGEQVVKNIARPVQVFGMDAAAIDGQPTSGKASKPQRGSARAKARAERAEDAAADGLVEEARPALRVWWRRLVIAALVIFVLSRIGSVRHAAESLANWATGTSVPAPAPLKVSQPKPAQLAPLPPPIVVPSAPGSGEPQDGTEKPASAPLELHPQDPQE